MVQRIGIDAGAHHLAQHAHVLSGVRGHQHRDLRMQQHPLGHQRGFNGVRGGLLVHPAHLHFMNHGQRHRARRRDAHRGMELRGVNLADIEEIAGSDGGWHRRCRLRAGQRWQPSLDTAVPGCRRFFGIGQIGVLLRSGNADHSCGQSGGAGRGRLAVSHCAGQHDRQQRHKSTRGTNRLHQERASHRHPEAGKERNGHVERQIGRHRLHRLAGIIHHGDIRTLDAGGQTRFLGLLQHPDVEFMIRIGLLAHRRVLGGRFIGLHACAGRVFKILADQLLAVDGHLPCAAEALHQPGILGLLLPLQILQLAANLDDAGKVGAVLDVELSLFLFELAALGVNLLEQRCGEVAAFGLQARIGGNDQLRIA